MIPSGFKRLRFLGLEGGLGRGDLAGAAHLELVSGIRPGQDRSTALFQLAAEIPAAVLARTLAISTDAAVIWQRHSAGDWITYAADVSRRSLPDPAR